MKKKYTSLIALVAVLSIMVVSYFLIPEKKEESETQNEIHQIINIDSAKILVENGFKDVSNAEGVKKYEYDLVKYKDITAEDMLALLEENKDAVLVDVRPEKDFKKGHIENAINVPFDQVESRLAELDKTKDIVLYCNTGNKSSSVAKQLQEKGYEKVYNAIDGVKEYEFKLVTE